MTERRVWKSRGRGRRVAALVGLGLIGTVALAAPAVAAGPRTKPSADLQVTIAGPTTGTIGQRVTETITVTNLGPDSSPAAVGVTTPSGLKYVSAPGSFRGFGTTDRYWDTATIKPGRDVVLTITDSVMTGTKTVVTITAFAASATQLHDPNLANNHQADHLSLN